MKDVLKLINDTNLAKLLGGYCKWTEDDLDYGCWHPSCDGDIFVLNSGTPAENKMKFCCYCGRAIKQVPYQE